MAMTLSTTTAPAGTPITIYLNAPEPPWSVKVYRGTADVLDEADLIAVVKTGTSGGTVSFDYTFPITEVATFPQYYDYGTYTIRYIGSGQASGYTFKLTIPPDIAPTVNSFTATLIPNVPEDITGYIQGYSGARLDVDASSAYGLPTTVKVTGFNFKSYLNTSYVLRVPLAGINTYEVLVTDSLGYTVTDTLDINVRAYSKPTLSDPVIYRCDSEGVEDAAGTYMYVKTGVNITTLDGENSYTLKMRCYKKSELAPEFTQVLVKDVALIYGDGLIDVSKTYVVDIQIQDLIASYIYTSSASSDVVGFHMMARGTGIGLGKYAEKAGWTESAFPIEADGNPVCAMPLGFVYMTVGSENPEDLYPGTTWIELAGDPSINTWARLT